MGIDLSSLAFIAGAIGVGLGFGLQNIISNFVSGLIILAERPISIGDRVELGEIAGLVTKINLRSTNIVTNDNITIIVPNSDFITSKVTNWSYGDPRGPHPPAHWRGRRHRPGTVEKSCCWKWPPNIRKF